MNAQIGLAIQCAGIMLIALLSFFMMRSIGSLALRYWTLAWFCLALALLSLQLGYYPSRAQPLFFACYFFAEYVFGYLFVTGCRRHASGAQLTRRHLWALLPAFLTALALAQSSADFNNLFIVHALLMACFFAAALCALQPPKAWWREPATPGLRIMSIALLLLTIDFLHYVPVFGARAGLWGVGWLTAYMQYTSIFDLILETLLGFGTVIVLMEDVRREIEAMNHELIVARDRLEAIARVDPLTEALNRHAFHALIGTSECRSVADAHGCVAIIDVDDLKPINDVLGHAAGDAAIRHVARVVRSVIRADDMLFRWGGDEFLVLMFGTPEAEARRRLDSLNELLAKVCQSELIAAPLVAVSHGLACFAALTELEQAVERADKAMYRCKQQRKQQATQSIRLTTESHLSI